jgi:hypothetical protein
MYLVGVNYATSEYLPAARGQANQYPFPITTTEDEKRPGRGNNWWRWKPQIILDALFDLQEDEALLYLDAQDLHGDGCFEFAKQYLQDNPILLHQNFHNHISYTKGDCYALMDCLQFFNEKPMQIEAGFLGLRKTDFTIDLMYEWSKWLHVDKAVNDDPSEYPNHPSFIDHRHDQSILTNLALLNDLPMVVVPEIRCNSRPKLWL